MGLSKIGLAVYRKTTIYGDMYVRSDIYRTALIIVLENYIFMDKRKTWKSMNIQNVSV